MDLCHIHQLSLDAFVYGWHCVWTGLFCLRRKRSRCVGVYVNAIVRWTEEWAEEEEEEVKDEERENTAL